MRLFQRVIDYAKGYIEHRKAKKIADMYEREPECIIIKGISYPNPKKILTEEVVESRLEVALRGI